MSDGSGRVRGMCGEGSGEPFPGCRWKSLTDEVRVSSRTLWGLLPESGAAFSKPV